MIMYNNIPGMYILITYRSAYIIIIMYNNIPGMHILIT